MIILAADIFAEDYVGGAELTTEAIIKDSLLPVQKVLCSNVTVKLMKTHQDKVWIFGNYANLNESCIYYAIKNLKYCVLEYDYKYCTYRSPEKHIAIAGECNCHFDRHGKLISAFYAKSLITWFMSEKQKQKYINKFSFLNSDNIKVLNSVFSKQTLKYIKSLDITSKNNKWLITNSSSWIKGRQLAIDYALENSLEYELVWGLEHKQLLKKMAEAKGVIYIPPGGDTCPRFIMEARMLGCDLILNENVQHKDEEWFNTATSTLQHCESRTEVFWSTLENLWTINTPPETKTNQETKFNIIVPFYNCEEWVLKCLDSVHKQKYSNYHCYIIDDMSSDRSSGIIKDFIQDKGKFTLATNKNKIYALGNIAKILNQNNHKAHDVNILLDGDDWLSSLNCLSYLNKVYLDTNCMMTYGTYVYYPFGTIGVEPSEYPEEIISKNGFRADKWRASHLRTFKHLLWQNLDIKDLQNKNGDYYKTAYDQALMLPLLEMSAERSTYIDRIMHVYNRNNPLNVDKTKQQLQYQTAQEIRGKSPYRRIA